MFVVILYGDTISQKIAWKLQKYPAGTCELMSPIADSISGLNIPIDAQHKEEIVWRKEAPNDFHAVLALMQVVSVAPCTLIDQEAKLAVRAMRLVERDPVAGTEQVVSEVSDFSVQTNTLFTGKLFQRIPQWYTGKALRPMNNMIRFEDRALIVDLMQAPQFIYHGWTEPQVEARPGKHYLVEMDVKITGQARLQMGVDYWRSVGASDIGWRADCAEANHCEGHLSKWFGPTEDWQVIRTPEALKQ